MYYIMYPGNDIELKCYTRTFKFMIYNKLLYKNLFCYSTVIIKLR